MTRVWPLLLLTLASCSAHELADLKGDTGIDSDNELDAAILRVDVIPPDETFGKLLSQTFRVNLERVDSGQLTLQLSSPGRITGNVTGYEVNPWLDADLPGDEISVEAEVIFRRLSSNQVFYTHTNARGRYDALVVPDMDYWLSVVPDRSDLPVHTFAVGLDGDAEVDVDLPQGSVVWGEVLDDEGEPLVGARVQAIDFAGVASSTATTDEDGRYLLRVVEGEHALRCLGREGGRDPVLSVASMIVDDPGRRVDFAYPQLEAVTVSGRVATSDGLPEHLASVQFTAVELDGYEEINASLVREALPSSQGTWDLSLLPGTWRAQVLPEDGVELTPLGVESVQLELGKDLDLGNLLLAPPVEVQGKVLDPRAEPVPRALLRFTEEGYGQRQWTLVVDDEGRFSGLLPQIPLAVSLTPPGELATDLSYTRAKLESPHAMLDGEEELVLRFQRGERVRGVVLDSEERPLGWAVVEIRDDSDDLWAATLTDTEGRFDIGVAWSAQ